MGSRRGAGWRDQASGELLERVLAREEVKAPVLLVDHPPGVLPPGIAALEPVRWDRADTGDRPGSAWPPEGPYGAALLRLPRSREALEFALHAVVSVTEPDAPVYVFGAKDEGIGSTAPRLEGLLEGVSSLATGGRCRVLRGFRPEAPGELRSRLAQWREVVEVDLGGGPEPWVRYPGTFARSGVDPGTALLLRFLPPAPGRSRVLDFGAGTGLLAAGVRRRSPEAELVLVEPDAPARSAAQENVPAARFASGTEWPALGPFGAIVSNPPYHQGKAETLAVVRSLVNGARVALADGGELRLVIQRRHPVEEELRRAFRDVAGVADEGPYRVWAASGAEPRSKSSSTALNKPVIR
ncbi:MAG: methyltransferase [Gemmatimonadota bacterium]